METVRPGNIPSSPNQTAVSRERDAGGLVFFKVERKLPGGEYLVRMGQSLVQTRSDIPLKAGETYRGMFEARKGMTWIRLENLPLPHETVFQAFGLPHDGFSTMVLRTALDAGLPFDRVTLKKARLIAQDAKHPEEAAFVFFHALKNGVELPEQAVTDLCRFADGTGNFDGESGNPPRDGREEGRESFDKEESLEGLLSLLPGILLDLERESSPDPSLLSIINDGSMHGFPLRKLVPFSLERGQVDLRGFLSIYYETESFVSRMDALVSSKKGDTATSWWCSVAGKAVRLRVPDGSELPDGLEKALALLGMSLECVDPGEILGRVDLNA